MSSNCLENAEILAPDELPFLWGERDTDRHGWTRWHFLWTVMKTFLIKEKKKKTLLKRMCALLCVGLSMMKGRLAEAWVRRKAKGDTWCSLTPATRCRRTTTSSPPAASSTSAERCGQRRTTALLVRASRQAPLRGSAALSVWDLSAPWGYGRALLLLLFLLFFMTHPCPSLWGVALHVLSCSMQSVISPSVATRSWKTERSATWAITTQTRVVTVRRSPWPYSADWNRISNAGTHHSLPKN